MLFILAIHAFLIHFFGEITSKPKLLWLSIDGFRNMYLKEHTLRNFNRLIDQGCTVKNFQSLFITKTFPNHMSLTTGLHEEKHGIMANVMLRDKDFPSDKFDQSTKDTKWWDIDGETVPIWIANQIAGYRSAGVFWPGTNVVFTHGRSYYYEENYDHSVGAAKRVEKGLNYLTNDPAVNLIMLYVAEIDERGHQFGPVSDEMATELQLIDSLVGKIVEKIDELNQQGNMVNLIITSDHGMSLTGFSIDLTQLIDETIYKMYSDGPIAHIFCKTTCTAESSNELAAHLNQHSQNNFTAYTFDSLPNDFHYKNVRRTPDIILVANFNYCFKYKNSCAIGDHGYSPKNEEMHPIFFGYGPNFKKDFFIEKAFVTDVVPLVCNILNLKDNCPSNQGSSTLLSMLKYVHSDGGTIIPIMLLFLVIFLICGVIIWQIYKRKISQHQTLLDETDN